MISYLRYFIYITSKKSSFLNFFYQIFYRTNYKLFCFIHLERTSKIYPRRGYLRGDVQPGVSDIDVLCILKSFDEDTLKSFLKRYKRYRFLYPLVCDVEILDENLFQKWKQCNDYRSVEFQALIGEKNINEIVTSESTFLFSCVKEIFNQIIFYITLLNLKIAFLFKSKLKSMK